MGGTPTLFLFRLVTPLHSTMCMFFGNQVDIGSLGREVPLKTKRKKQKNNRNQAISCVGVLEKQKKARPTLMSREDKSQTCLKENNC